MTTLRRGRRTWRATTIGLIVVAGCATGPVDGGTSSRSGAGTNGATGAETSAGTGVDLRFAPPDAGAACSVSSIDRDGVAARAKAFSARHGVETLVAFDGCPTTGQVACEPVPSAEYAGVVTFLDQVEEDVGLYPADFFRDIHLDLIVFAGKLTRADEAADQRDAVGGALLPYGDHRSMLYLSSAQARFCNAPLNRRTIHHEVAHAIDIGFAGVTESNWWPTLNPAGFTYGDVDWGASDLLDFDHPGPGLVSRYARASVKEDYAEVYTAMFVTKHADRLAGWLREDRWLDAKFRNVLRALAARWPGFVEAMPNHASLP